MEERIQKILAHAGFGSRRSCEELIAAGRVTVNGKVVSLGSKADAATDRISVDGRLVQTSSESVYVAIHKPRGVLSTVTAPDPRPTVRDLVDLPGRLYPVGRLDVDSEGLILLTNDGELANRLTHPRFGHEKEYRVLVARRPDEEQLASWRRGVVLEDGTLTAPAQVSVESPFGKGAWMRVILREGRKRQIREMGALTGLPVVRIVRIRIGSLLLGRLKPREWRLLTPDEIADLKQAKRAPRAGRSPARAPRRPGAKDSAGSKWAERRQGPARDSSRPARKPGPKADAGGKPGEREPGPARDSSRPARRPGPKTGPEGKPGERGPGPARDSSRPARRPGPKTGPGGKPGERGRAPDRGQSRPAGKPGSRPPSRTKRSKE